MADLLLGIDVGTGSAKACLTDRAGEVLATDSIEHTTSTPRPGWFEHDPDALWWAQVTALCRRILDAGHSKHDIGALAVSAIGPCVVPLGVDGHPLRPGILYGVDTRATDQIRDLNETIGDDTLVDHAGMALSSQATVPKMLWIRDNEPDVWDSTATMTTASSYIVYRLVGSHSIDPHQAAHFLPFYDAERRAWTDRFADRIPGFDLLPEVREPIHVAGTLTRSAAADTGLVEGTPVAVGTVDAAAEAIGVGVRRPGDLMVMYGSTMFFILVAAHRTEVPGAWLVGGLEDSQFNVAAGLSTAGSLTEWVRKVTKPATGRADGYAELFEAAASVPPGSGGLLMLPYFEGERTPISDPEATGVLVGIGLEHGPPHIMRATLESVAFAARHNIETMESAGATVERLVAVGGGTSTDLWLSIVSDVTGKPQHVPNQRIGASYGNAFIAGVATGALRTDDIESWTAGGRTIEPRGHDVYDDFFGHYQDLYRSTARIQHALKGHRSTDGG